MEPPCVDFTLEPGGTISGRVLDLDGNPVYGVTVEVRSPEIFSLATEPYETYVFRGLPYGTYTVTCPARLWGSDEWSWEQQVFTVVVDAAAPGAVCDFYLLPSTTEFGSISRTIYDDATPPNPLVGASVDAFSVGDPLA